MIKQNLEDISKIVTAENTRLEKGMMMMIFNKAYGEFAVFEYVTNNTFNCIDITNDIFTAFASENKNISASEREEFNCSYAISYFLSDNVTDLSGGERISVEEFNNDYLNDNQNIWEVVTKRVD